MTDFFTDSFYRSAVANQYCGEDLATWVREQPQSSYPFSDYDGFCREYKEEGWLGRKFTAIPMALLSATKPLYRIARRVCLAVLNTPLVRQTVVPTWLGPHLDALNRRLSVYSEFCSMGCDLQESLGRVVQLLSDRYGLFLVQKSEFHRSCYDCSSASIMETELDEMMTEELLDEEEVSLLALPANEERIGKFVLLAEQYVMLDLRDKARLTLDRGGVGVQERLEKFPELITEEWLASCEQYLLVEGDFNQKVEGYLALVRGYLCLGLVGKARQIFEEGDVFQNIRTYEDRLEIWLDLVSPFVLDDSSLAAQRMEDALYFAVEDAMALRFAAMGLIDVYHWIQEDPAASTIAASHTWSIVKGCCIAMAPLKSLSIIPNDKEFLISLIGTLVSGLGIVESLLELGSNMGANLQAEKELKDRWYKVLGLSSSASKQEVKKAYHKRALNCHPDKVNRKEGESEEAFRRRFLAAEEKFKSLTEAYNGLVA